MIIDLSRFIEKERPYWRELEAMVGRLEEEPTRGLDLASARRLHYLYTRAASDLAQVSTFASERELRGYLETLVARAYAEIHASRERPTRLRPLRWFFGTFPRTVRAHWRALAFATAFMAAGSLFGGLLLVGDSETKEVVLPWSHLEDAPSERVAREEAREEAYDGMSTFSAYLMMNNIRVSILALAMGITWGIGTVVMLFYNGVILGMVGLDYVLDGEAVFLFAWLLPHGSVEIPAILLAGQAGFVIAAAMVGKGSRQLMHERLREVAPDVVTLIGGVAAFLVWAGLVEAFFSQYHYPVFPYWLKILFGAVQLALVGLFLFWCGRSGEKEEAAPGAGAPGVKMEMAS